MTSTLKYTMGLLFFVFVLASCRLEAPKPTSQIETEVTSETSTSEGGLTSVYQLKYPLKATLVSGHRGAKTLKNFPENCLETFEHLDTKNIAIIECDVASTKDGKLVLMHDDALERTTNGFGRVDQMDSDEVLGLNLKDYKGKLSTYKVPTFEATLAWAKKSNAILSVDIKRSVRYEKVVDAIRKAGAENNCMLISYSLNQSRKLYKLAPEMMQSVSIRNEEELRRWEDAAVPPADKVIAFTGTRQSPKSLYDALHKRGIACIFGTIGNIDRQAKSRGEKVYHELIEKGIDIIATDRPIATQKAIDNY